MLKDHTAIYYLFIQLVNAVHFSILKFRICDYKFPVENARYDILYVMIECVML